MKPAPRWPQRAIAVLLVVAAALFVIGVSAESDNDTHSDGPAATPNEQSDAGEHNEQAERGTDEVAEHGEEVLGIDVESPVLLIAAVVVSLLLAVLVWRRPDRKLLLAIAVVGAGFAVLDIAEVAHQLDEDRTGLAVLAAVIAAFHAAAAALAIQQGTTTTQAAGHHATTS